MGIKGLYGVIVVSVLMALAVSAGLSQSSQNSVTTRTDQTSTPRAAIEDAIRKVIQDYVNALVRRDLPAILAYYADDGMFFDSDEGRTSGARLKQLTREAFDYYTKNNVKDAYEIKDLYVQQLANDLALANYVEVLKRTTDGKTEVLRMAETSIFAFRNGHWVAVAAHTEALPKPVEPVVVGMPIDWQRAKTSVAADSYSVTVDRTVHHAGKASLSMRFMCGSDPNSWVGLAQGIDASRFKGKRVRFSGWIRTTNSDGAGLWLRADAERSMIAFDNMQERLAKGTADWKLYEIVLDIPDNAINLAFGANLLGKGQAWFDDLSIEVVGPNIPVTAKPLEPGKSNDYSDLVKRSMRTEPVNLGFENGAVR